MRAAVQILQSWRGLVLVFLAYFFFLLFSQFTLLHLLRERLGPGHILDSVLGVMALGGIGGSLLSVLLRERIRRGNLLVHALLVCAATAFIAAFGQSAAVFLLAASVMGFALGVLTVSTAALLPALTVSEVRGRVVGLGTGLAYAACNLPVLFTASSETRALVSGAVLLAGGLLMAVAGVLPRESSDTSMPAGARRDVSLTGAWRMLPVFGILVWLDSALFFQIQEIRALKDSIWQSDNQLYSNAGLHLAAAMVAGLLLDRAKGTQLLLTAWIGLAIGALGLRYAPHAGFSWLYVMGVSFYSTALVWMPSLHSDMNGGREAFIRAAVVYAVAGWIGSALGIGMVKDLNGIPVIFIAMSSFIVVFIARLSSWLRE